MLKFHDVEQNSDDWFKLRAGNLTSSNLSKVMANYGKAFGEPAKKLAVNIALEQVTGKPIASGYSNDHMTRGHEQEPMARMLYENTTFCEVTNGGFFSGDFFGCSPDGMVSEGVIEIKSVTPHVHLANISRGGIDPAYKWQCCANLYYTGSEWLDFISYCADFPPDKQLYICRIERDTITEEIEQVQARIELFKDIVDLCKESILTGDYFVKVAA